MKADNRDLRPCKKRPLDTVNLYIYRRFSRKVICSFYTVLISFRTLTRGTGIESEDEPVAVVRVVVVLVAVVVDLREVIRIVRRTQPPVVGRAKQSRYSK